MILTHDVILREIESKRIVIEPFSPNQVGPASIDLHLADEIRVMEGGPDVIDPAPDTRPEVPPRFDTRSVNAA